MSLTVFIIRHGEKQEKKSDPPGIDANGVKDKKALTVRGWQRAGAWAAHFGSASSELYPAPNLVYAVNPDHGPVDQQPSHRPLQTVTPLADRLGLKVRTEFEQGQEKALVNEIETKSGVILIAWEHKRIGEGLLPAFFGSALPANAPTKWDKTRFDVILRLHREHPSQPWSFQQLFPCLLSGDSTKPMF